MIFVKKVIISSLLGVGLFTAGVYTGKRSQMVSHEKRTRYAGDVRVVNSNDPEPEIYLALNVSPEELIGSSDVIFKVVKM